MQAIKIVSRTAMAAAPRARSKSSPLPPVAATAAQWLLAAGASAGAVYSCAEMDKGKSVEEGVKKMAAIATNPSAERLEELRPKGVGYVRIDEKVLSERSDFVSGHALHEALKGNSMVDTFEIYVNPTTSDLHVVAHFGSGVNGHPAIVHGGILALTFDESFGWLLHFGLKTSQAFTANLNVNYR